MKNLVFFLSLIALAVVAWNKDESPANPIINTSTNTVAFDPGDSSSFISITVTGTRWMVNSHQGWDTLSTYCETTKEKPVCVYFTKHNAATGEP